MTKSLRTTSLPKAQVGSVSPRSAANIRRFYGTQSVWSDPGRYGRLFDNLPADVETLCRVVRNVVLHFRAGPHVGFDIPLDRLAEIDTRHCELMLHRIVELADESIDRPRTPEQRLIGCCRDASLLLCAMLRHKGTPARLRYGFAPYLNDDDSNGDHAVVEFWNGTRWLFADPERTGPDVSFAGRSFSPVDIPVGAFLPAGPAWMMVRNGEADASTFRATPQVFGLPLVRLAVLIDVAMQNKSETLLWDVWGIGGLEHQISPDEVSFLDQAAAVSTRADVESAYPSVAELFMDERVRLPETITSFSPVRGPVAVKLGDPAAL